MNLKTQVSNSFGGTGAVEVSRYEYQYDQLGRRENVKTSGAAFAAAAFTHWGYDERNQLDTSDRHLGTDLADLSQPVTAEKRDYDYDPIGNRETALDQDGVTSLTYTANQLNQYDLIDAATPTYDADGNMLSDGSGRTLTYNGENRLVGFSDGTTTASYVYDYIGRRVSKSIAGGATTTFLYDGWNMIREDVDADGAGPATPVASHQVWGLDLSQSMQGAGGIGGLVAVVDGTGAASLFAFDGNGNVSEVVTGGAVAAHYEYDAFGNVIAITGGGANPWRFSTKYVDGESGYSYYGYRYYWSEAGRWLRRDPIEEPGFMAGAASAGTSLRRNPVRAFARADSNVYGYVQNLTLQALDPFGLETEPQDACCTCGPEAKDALRTAYFDVVRRFGALSEDAKEHVCEPFATVYIPWFGSGATLKTRAGSEWDLAELSDEQLWADTFGTGGCGVGKKCQETVGVEGRCHWIFDVNYLLYGWLNKQCGVTKTGMLNRIRIWKSGKEKRAGPKGPKVKDRVEEPLAWAALGFDGYPGTPSSVLPASSPGARSEATGDRIRPRECKQCTVGGRTASFSGTIWSTWPGDGTEGTRIR